MTEDCKIFYIFLEQAFEGMETLEKVILYHRTADGQADLSLRWAHMPFCWFCRAAVHIVVYVHLHEIDM